MSSFCKRVKDRLRSLVNRCIPRTNQSLSPQEESQLRRRMDQVSDERRRERARHQRIYLLDMSVEEEDELEGPKICFNICGSTGNLYKVYLYREEPDRSPTCNCPDVIQRNRKCKHQYFVEMYALREVKPLDRWDTALERLAHLYREKDRPFEPRVQQVKIIALDENSECAICLETLREGQLTICSHGCGNSVHTDCIDMWKKMNSERTCPYCRAFIP